MSIFHWQKKNMLTYLYKDRVPSINTIIFTLREGYNSLVGKGCKSVYFCNCIMDGFQFIHPEPIRDTPLEDEFVSSCLLAPFSSEAYFYCRITTSTQIHARTSAGICKNKRMFINKYSVYIISHRCSVYPHLTFISDRRALHSATTLRLSCPLCSTSHIKCFQQTLF